MTRAATAQTARTWLRLGRTAALAIGAWLFESTAAHSAEALSPERLGNMSLEELMELEVTSVSRRPEKLSQAASAIQVITSEEIRRSGATSIPEALRLADNLDVARKNSHDWAITARGFNTELANKLLVMIDGRTVYTPLFSGVFWDRQNYLLEDIDRIEVISGPGGTLWGANAVNGVINIITKSAARTDGTYLEAGGGDQLHELAGARIGGEVAPNAFARVYGMYFDRGAEVFDNGASAHDGWSKGQAGFRVDATPSQRDALTFQGDIYDGDENLVGGGDSEVSGANLLGRWTRTLANRSELSLQTYYDRTHLSEPVPAIVINGAVFAPAGVLEDDLETFDVDLQHRSRVGGRQQFVWGLGFRATRDSVENAPALAFVPAHLNQERYSGFVQDEISLRKDLLLTLGTKLEHNGYTGLELEPSARLQWNLDPKQTLWAAVSRAVRVPSRVDRDLSQPAPGGPLVILSGSGDFDSEVVVASELGYRAEVASHLTASISLFYNDYSELRSTTTTPLTVLPFVFANDLEGETHGVELSLTWQVREGWRLHGGYAYLEEDLRVKPGKIDINDGLNETADPRHRASLRSAWDLPRNLQLDAALRWVGERPIHSGPVLGHVPSYGELDLRLAWHPNPRFELSLVGQNLLHDQHPEYGYPDPTRVEIERAAYVKAAWKFD